MKRVVLKGAYKILSMIFPIKNWESMLGWPDNINYDF